MQKTTARLIATLLCLLLALPAGLAEEVSLKDDFYEAINAEWLAQTELTADAMSVGAFEDIGDAIEATLIADFDGMLAGEVAMDNAELEAFIAMYGMATDWDARNAQGGEPLQPYLAQIEALETLADLDAALADWSLAGMPLPLQLLVDSDMGDVSQYALYAMAPSLFLPDRSYYDEGNAVGTYLLSMYAAATQNLLMLAGYSEDEAATITGEAIAYDAMLVPYTKTAEEASDVALLYNPVSLADFAALSTNLDLAALVAGLTDVALEQIVVTDTSFFEGLDTLVSEETFAPLKSWMTVSMVWGASSFLSHSFREAAGAYTMLLTGQMELIDAHRNGYYTAAGLFGGVVGDYFGRTYFGEEAKADVTAMVEAITAQYKTNLETNDWLSDATREQAIKKLDNMALQIGYPDAVEAVYSQIAITSSEEGGTLLSNAMDISTLLMADNYAQLGQPVDRSRWPLSADTVNAMYNPMNNTITFPAAILQAPFYSLEQSASENLGGIGVVIAHEISHAFDPNGAQFDELGNFKNWWTEEDYAAFSERATAMVTAFDGLPSGSGTVNGTLTVTENIADAGGLRCAIAVAKTLEDADLAGFFTNYATIWRSKMTPEYESLLLTVDTHAPSKLRVNHQVSMMDEFYEVFDITEADGMYLAPEERVSVW